MARTGGRGCLPAALGFTLLRMLILLGRLVDERLVNMGDDATAGDGRLQDSAIHSVPVLS